MKRPRCAEYKSVLEYRIAVLLWENKVKFTYETEKWRYGAGVYQGKCADCKSTAVVSQRIYTPDFFLPYGVVLECKGNFTPALRTKMLEIREANPDRDLRFVFQRDNWLTKKHANRYSDWCKQQGFLYYINDIPEEFKCGRHR